MPIGTGTIRGSEIVTEVGGTKPYRLNSSAVRSLAGVNTTETFRLSQLRGKSAITVDITGSILPQRQGSGYQSRGTLSITRSGNGTITAYRWWQYDNNVSLITSSPTESTYTVSGPSYRIDNLPESEPVTFGCDVTINGVVYVATRVYNIEYEQGLN